MRAARLAGPKHFEILETDAPVAADGQCLIRLERVSVCGSDCRHGFQIRPEERVLVSKFGEDYAVYCSQVRRWI